jgi:hypothetical protein
VEGNHIDENVDMVGLVNDAFVMADQVTEDVHNHLMDGIAQDGDNAMGGIEVEGNRDVDKRPYFGGLVNDQEHVVEDVEKANNKPLKKAMFILMVET